LKSAGFAEKGQVMARTVKVSTVSFLTSEESTTVEANMLEGDRIIELVLAAKPDIVCFPELFPVVNICKDEIGRRAEEIQRMTLEWASKRSKQGHTYLIVPTLEKAAGHLYNTAFLIDRCGKILGKYRKTHLAPEEKNFFCVDTPGDTYPVFETDFGKVAIMTCMDVHYPEVARIYALEGAEILFWPTVAYGPTEEFLHIALRSRAIDNQLYCVASNYVNVPYLPGKLMGRAAIIGLDGTYRADTGNRPGVATAVVDLDEGYEMWYTGEIKMRFPTLRETFMKTRRPETYGKICERGCKVTANHRDQI
jgi:predicted amidohydrolase